MAYHNTVFSQLLKLVPRHEFETLANWHHEGRKLRKMTRSSQFVAMTMAQLAGRASLRDVVSNLGTQSAKLSDLGYLLMKNRHGLVVESQTSQATGTAEREAGVELVEALGGSRRITLGADKNYDTQGFVAAMRGRNVTPHVAQNTAGRRSAIDGRTIGHPGYRTSLTVRKRIEECFGWLKTLAGLRKSRFVGREKLDSQFVLSAAAYNRVRMRNLGLAAC